MNINLDQAQQHEDDLNPNNPQNDIHTTERRELADGTSFYPDDWIDGASELIRQIGLDEFLDLWSERMNNK